MRFPTFVSKLFERVRVNKVIRVLILSDFFLFSGVGLMSPIFAVFITEQIKGGSISVAGFAAAIYLMCKSLLPIPIARFMDIQRGEKDDFRVMMFGSIVMALVPFVYLFVRLPWELYVVQAIYGIGAAFAFVSWQAIFTRHVDKEDVALEWGVYNTLTDLGGAAAAGIGGAIAQALGFHLLFILTGVILLCGVGALFGIARRFT
ncbi:MAG: hypothetical protein COV41_02915 [Candidatus Brennerbacteria bacterium CG11_big_fil_rev_8_21_14_0_20_43_10]|uniref:Major facilitator superfamily (MFS) profile domain-containing protein n=2 Tax=Candidatus Brenneribacteriota TaxID=1817902 RepID=A0A2H9N4A6_9BACT|nr:MAG: hypothetical protein AUJ43_00650 [Parcubacteria group bacterium CG1_02_44_31]PIR25395.1 MAG: hypothetical protein COV41_02915 [Candidatus Brennerbacteria bacterium CG11_big_fil_rev_8_21_14_0_20_43_10]PIX28728.1 MAG: hypothetical protein COZ64_02215 [Candidatus Brennerbacteria bacterium CG_4_8_14_3_um_filter_43_14]PJA19267.1 MAG: hypothetical protein COX61_01705 [Candidatus Brennerbacteria bacterium CG_4_10_14_0_2_um_filter_43_14]